MSGGRGVLAFAGEFGEGFGRQYLDVPHRKPLYRKGVRFGSSGTDGESSELTSSKPLVRTNQWHNVCFGGCDSFHLPNGTCHSSQGKRGPRWRLYCERWCNPRARSARPIALPTSQLQDFFRSAGTERNSKILHQFILRPASSGEIVPMNPTTAVGQGINP
jgi:hypothetical protein